MPALLIEDGYTAEGEVPEMRGRTPRVGFTYRPALPEAVKSLNLAPRQTGKQLMDVVVEFLDRQLVSWDVTDRKGEPVPINRDTLRRVPDPVLVALVDIVAGYAPAQADADAGNSFGR